MNEAPWYYYGKQLTQEDLDKICEKFPDAAMGEMGFGDLSIIRAYECYRDDTPEIEEIRIWSLDEHLRGYHEYIYSEIRK